MKRFILIGVVFMLSLTLLSANVWAKKEKKKNAQNNSRIQALEAEDIIIHERIDNIPPGLQGPQGPKGDPGPPGICESCGSSTPPIITHNAPPISSNIEEEIIFTLSDDVELSHFILQGDASPHIQLTEYFKPGVNNIAITHTFGVPIEILAIVFDTEGNATKNLIVIEQEGGELLDNDGDGFTVDDGDCDDNDPDVFFGNTELCDGKDNDCNYVADFSNGWGDETIDADMDGALACKDCDDNDPDVFFGNTELCDGKDNDCDGETDENCGGGDDYDGDGWTAADGDCDDRDSDVYPGNPEICDGKDNNCDSDVDNASAFQLCGTEGICAGVMGCQSK